MALLLGTGLIETRGPIKLPKLQDAMQSALVRLGFEQTFEGKDPPEDELPDDMTQFDLLATAEGVLAIQLSEAKVVRDLARMVSEHASVRLLVFTTEGALFGRRSVEVTCRKFEVTEEGREAELPVMATHTAEVTDVEHNELRQAPQALRSRIQVANESLLTAEGTPGFKLKKVFRYKRIVKNVKLSPRLARIIERIERCESFAVFEEGDQLVVKLTMAGAKSLSYLKREEAGELEKALEGRPEIARRRSSA